MKHTRLILVWMVVAAALALPGRARADEKTVKAIERLNREAMENYDLLDYEAAKRSLNEALAMAKKKRLDKHPVKAQTHLHLGIVELSGFGDRESALLQLMDAVAIDPKIEVPAAYRTDDLTALLDEARSQGGGGGGGGGGGEPAGPSVDCASIMGMQHELVDEAKTGADTSIDAYVAADVGAAKVTLYYRPQGDEGFIEVPMKKSGDCRHVGVIPGDAMGGEFMHYYVAALSDKSKVLASKGSAGSPNIIEIQAAGGGGGGFDEGGGAFDEENPLAPGGGPRKRPTGGSGGGSRKTNGSVGGSVEIGPKVQKYFVSLAVGSGGGYVTGDTEVTREPVGCCFAPALFHVFPEVGYMLDKRSSISAAFRMGFTVGANVPGKAPGAPAGLLRYRRTLKETGEGLGISGAVGFGVVRNTVKLAEPMDPDQNVDTVASGPLLVGAGATYLSSLGGPMRFVAELNAIAGVPVISEMGATCGTAMEEGCVRFNLGVQFDLNLGLLFAF